MNKRGLIKSGVITLFSILVLTFIIISLSVKSTSAIIEKNTYILGEKVKINIEDYYNTKILIITPSEIYSLDSRSEIIIFKPEEPGLYRIQVEENAKVKTFEEPTATISPFTDLRFL